MSIILMAIWNMLSFNKWSTILKMKYILELYYETWRFCLSLSMLELRYTISLKLQLWQICTFFNKKIYVDCFACIVKWNKLWQGRSLFLPQIHSFTYWNVNYKTCSFLISSYQFKTFNKILFICRRTRLLGTTRS